MMMIITAVIMVMIIIKLSMKKILIIKIKITSIITIMFGKLRKTIFKNHHQRQESNKSFK